MEGFMYKWTNYVYGWKKRYFILHNGVLEYCKEKGGERKGAIHLNVSQVIQHSKNLRRIIIDTGTTVVHLKANTESDALEWLNALQASQEILQKEFQREEIRDRLTVAPLSEGQSHLNTLLNKITSLWELHSQLEDAYSQLPSNVKTALPTGDKLVKTAGSFKAIATEILSLFEEEHLNISKTVKEQSHGITTSKEQAIIDRDAAEFLSFESNEPEDLFFDALEEVEPTATVAPFRKCLPVLRNPKQKQNVWKVVKDSIGKKISKIAVPLTFAEPLSILQRLSEDLTFSYLLVKADQSDDQWLRLAYVACFAVSTYANTINRSLKPFDAVLGETFELEADGFRLICEQVSHRPSVLALHCDHENFSFWSNITIESSFEGTYLQVNPIGDLHVTLKHHSDHFVWNKATTTVHNIILGKVYVDNHGTIDLVNTQTQDRCRLSLKKLGWFEQNPHTVEGSVFDSENAVKYTVSGTWSDHLIVKSEKAEEEVLAWELPQAPEGNQSSYFLSMFALQLNLPTESFSKVIPESDSRYRGDMRFLENGDVKSAITEKLRIEEKQRAARKLREVEKTEYRPRWFSLIDGEWRYSGNYWESKELGRFENVQSLFS